MQVKALSSTAELIIAVSYRTMRVNALSLAVYLFFTLYNRENLETRTMDLPVKRRKKYR